MDVHSGAHVMWRDLTCLTFTLCFIIFLIVRLVLFQSYLEFWVWTFSKLSQGEKFCDSFQNYWFSVINFNYRIAFSLNSFLFNNKTFYIVTLTCSLFYGKWIQMRMRINLYFSEAKLDIIFSLGIIVRTLLSKLRLSVRLS